MTRQATAPQLSKDEVRFFERHMAELPIAKSEVGQSEADNLLKFSYHQNPYVRTFAKVLWSGFAISRGQLVDGSQRFAQARRDATVSAIDAATTKAMDQAAAALEAAMAPNGSMATFLQELRDKTNQRLWARVCETAGMPPPSFAAIMRQQRKANLEELDADEEAEIAALRRTPAPAAAAAVAAADPASAAAGPHSGAAGPHSAAADADSAAEDEDGEADDDGTAGSGDGAAALQLAIARNGNADTLAEMLLAACAEALREARVKGATGALRVTLSVEGQRQGGGQNSGGQSSGGHSRRRRRRR